MDRGDLLAKVFAQIVKDVYVEDFTAIEELLVSVSDKQLQDFLPEDDNDLRPVQDWAEDE